MFASFGQSSGVIEGFGLADLAKVGSAFATRPSLFHHIATREELEGRARDLFEMLGAGSIRAEVRQSYPLSDVAEAHRALEGRKTTGATVLIP
jgi:NADPH2:quinone reductase